MYVMDFKKRDLRKKGKTSSSPNFTTGAVSRGYLTSCQRESLPYVSTFYEDNMLHLFIEFLPTIGIKHLWIVCLATSYMAVWILISQPLPWRPTMIYSSTTCYLDWSSNGLLNIWGSNIFSFCHRIEREECISRYLLGCSY